MVRQSADAAAGGGNMMPVLDIVGRRIRGATDSNSRSAAAVERESWPGRACVRSGGLLYQAARNKGGQSDVA
jgi:hypothetical protein